MNKKNCHLNNLATKETKGNQDLVTAKMAQPRALEHFFDEGNRVAKIKPNI